MSVPPSAVSVPPPSRLTSLARTSSARLTGALRACADFVVPAVCLGCQCPLGSHDALCADCWCQIVFIQAPLCDRLGIPLPFDPGGTVVSAAAAARSPLYDRARAVAVYDGLITRMIHGFKYYDRHDVRHLFGRWMVQAGRDLLADADLIVPVPLNRWRLISRRFNQAAMLAQEVSRLSRVPYDPGILRRTKATPSQVGLTQAERRRNVRAAFTVRQDAGRSIEGKRILLIDDVVTTGATVEACARMLRRAGADRIDVLALALVATPAVAAT
jgi:ComF family protein